MQTLSSRGKPRGRNGGRKPSKEPAKNKRTAQLRVSQKIFRAKQKARLCELEAKERELETVKYENAKLNVEKGILLSVVNCLRLDNFFHTSWDDFVRSKYDHNGGKESGNFISDSLQASKFSLKLRFLRELFTVCGKNLCSPLLLPNYEHTYDYLDREEESYDEVIPCEYPISCQKPTAFSEILTFQEVCSNRSYENTHGSSVEGMHYYHGAGTVNSTSSQFDEKSKSVNDNKIVKRSNLLSAFEIWNVIESSSEFSMINFDNLSQDLKKEIFCLNLELVIKLDAFIRIFSLHIFDGKKV